MSLDKFDVVMGGRLLDAVCIVDDRSEAGIRLKRGCLQRMRDECRKQAFIISSKSIVKVVA